MTPGPGERGARARRSFILAAAVLFVCLVAILIYGWLTLRGSAMSTAAVIALVIGVVLTLGLGIGLMTLLFYSHNEGYDDNVGR